MICGLEQCPDCDATVIRAVYNGRDLLVEAVPHDDGILELAGMRTLRKPIAIRHVGELPGINKLYRPHRVACTKALVPA